jgi:3-deoxy-manno-octulosonate cytidylyltransferase (CMP-KDO synthetase)
VRVLTIIPARIGSFRLPEKPLLHIRGEPLIRWVARRAQKLALGGEIVVATDDERILQAVRPMGVRGVMTDPAHRSGTERVAEVLGRPEYDSVDAVLNLQCDQPFLPTQAATGALQQVQYGLPLGTAAAPLQSRHLTTRDVVKVSVDRDGRAMSFYRGEPLHPKPGAQGPYHHLGVYAYSRAAAFEWLRLPACLEEHNEKLEQLRPLLAGIPIGVALLDCDAPLAIDTEDDLRRAQHFRSATTVQTRMSA